MKTYLVTFVVELPEERYADWSEQNDVYGSVLWAISKDEGHLIKAEEVPNNFIDKYAIFDEFGSV